MVRHLPEMLRLCGGHCLVVSTLFEAADRIGLADVEVSYLSGPSSLVMITRRDLTRISWKQWAHQRKITGPCS